MAASKLDFRASTSRSADFMPHYQLQKTLYMHLEGINSLKFSPNGDYLATASSDGGILVWGAYDGELKTILMGHRWAVNDLAWTSDSLFLVSASSDRTLQLWDLEAERYMSTFKGHSRSVMCCDFKPQSTIVVSGSADTNIRLWDPRAKDLALLLSEHTNAVTAVQFNEDGNRLVSSSFDGHCRLWDTETGLCVTPLLEDTTSRLGGAMFCPYESGILVSKLDNRIELWDPKKCELLKEYTGHVNTRISIAGTFTAASSKGCIVSGSEDGSVFIWDACTTNVIQKLTGHTDIVQNTACHPQQNLIASSGTGIDKTIKIWKGKNESNE